ncbi:aprataxin-like protein [Perkinsus chesapeaki]|uniref:Aprataxin-like protein n=1 Tax=Perkinsus chesapeaki TaxID=330153 RepID=A0A7J6ML95_PERCH|nr:aprataxin-like protein [Perkinsus chesapeaki]
MSALGVVKTCRDEIPKGPTGGMWRRALYDLIDHPGKYASSIFHKSKEGFTTVYDGFPKSTVHLLVLPDRTLKGPQQLTKDGEFGIPFLRRLHGYCDWLVNELQKQEHIGKLGFKCGIHAVPSLEPFHVHIISGDMKSDRIKHKKHWNSFTTPFFVELNEVESILQIEGSLRSILARESHLKDDLVCNICGENFGRFLKFKEHRVSCRKTKSSAAGQVAVSQNEIELPQTKRQRLC